MPGKQRTYRCYASPEVGETVGDAARLGRRDEEPRPRPVRRDRRRAGGRDVHRSGHRRRCVGDASAGRRRASGRTAPRTATSRCCSRTRTRRSARTACRTRRRSAGPSASTTTRRRWPTASPRDSDTGAVFRSTPAHGDPPTPLLEAFAGDAVRVHVLAPWSEQNQVFTIEGHRWPRSPGSPARTCSALCRFGAIEAITLELAGGAGGPEHLAGDYVYGDHREPYRQAGLWGIFRVYTPADRSAPIEPLPGTACRLSPVHGRGGRRPYSSLSSSVRSQVSERSCCGDRDPTAPASRAPIDCLRLPVRNEPRGAAEPSGRGVTSRTRCAVSRRLRSADAFPAQS